MSHISDSEFQELLDGNLNERQSKLFLRHIWDCQLCRQEWQTYLQLKKKLKQAPEIQLSKDFTDNVLAALSGALPHFKLQRWIAAVAGFGISAITGTLYYFRVAVKHAFFSKAGFESPLLQFQSIFGAIRDFILRIGGDQVILFLIACLALLLIGMLDKKIIQPRTKRSFQLLNGIS